MNADLLFEIVQDKNWTALQTEFDLYVAQPSFFSGTVSKGSPYITSVAMGMWAAISTRDSGTISM